jgi:hypothetical protein
MRRAGLFLMRRMRVSGHRPRAATVLSVGQLLEFINKENDDFGGEKILLFSQFIFFFIICNNERLSIINRIGYAI